MSSQSFKEAAELFGNKWILLIIEALLGGPYQSVKLEKSLKISPSVLQNRLNRLARHGLVVRTAYQKFPWSVEYSLTPKGELARPIIEAIQTCSRRYIDD